MISADVQESLNELRAHFPLPQCSHCTWKSSTTRWKLNCWCSSLPYFKVDPLLPNSVPLVFCFLSLRVAEVSPSVWHRFIPNIHKNLGGRNLVWAGDVLHPWRISEFCFFTQTDKNREKCSSLQKGFKRAHLVFFLLPLLGNIQQELL